MYYSAGYYTELKSRYKGLLYTDRLAMDWLRRDENCGSVLHNLPCKMLPVDNRADGYIKMDLWNVGYKVCCRII